MGSIIWIAMLPEATELWEWRLQALLPGLHHRALLSHKGFLKVGEGTAPLSPSAQQIPPPLWASRSLFHVLHPVLQSTFYHNIYLPEWNILLVPSVTQILPGSLITVWRHWLVSHHIHYLESLKCCLRFLCSQTFILRTIYVLRSISHIEYFHPTRTQIQNCKFFYTYLVLWVLNCEFCCFRKL